MRRRDFLHHLLWGGAVLAGGSVLDAERIAAAASGQIDRRLLDDLHVVADDEARRLHIDAPGDLLPQVESHLTYARAILRSLRSPTHEVPLHHVAGTLAAVAGKLSFYLGNRGDAHAYYLSAEGHAQEAGDGSLRAYVLSQRSQLHSDAWSGWRGTRSSRPLQLLEEAHTVAGAGSPPWLRAYLLGHRAEEHAIRGDARAAHRNLDDADQALGTATSSDLGFFAHWHDASVARLVCFTSKRGNCAQLLGASAEAATIIEDALTALSPSLASMRSNGLVDLAMAYAKEREVEHACGLLTESLGLCAERGLVAHVQRVVGVRKHLSRWQDMPAVRDLDEQLHQVTWAPLGSEP